LCTLAVGTSIFSSLTLAIKGLSGADYNGIDQALGWVNILIGFGAQIVFSLIDVAVYYNEKYDSNNTNTQNTQTPEKQTNGTPSDGGSSNQGSNSDWTKQTDKMSTHKDVHGRSGDLPSTSTPNSS